LSRHAISVGCVTNQKEIHPQKKTAGKKLCKGDLGKNYQASAFYYPGPVFCLKNSSTSYCPPNYAQPQGDKKIMP